MQDKKKVAAKSNGKWILTSTLVLVVALSTAGYAMQGFRDMRGGPDGEFFKERILSRVDYTMQELKPSQEQYAKYTVIRAKMEKALDAASKQRDEARKAMHAELAKPTPDMRTLAKMMKAKSRSIPDSVSQQVDYLLEVYDILTPAQQTELVSMLKSRMDHEGGPRRGPRPDKRLLDERP